MTGADDGAGAPSPDLVRAVLDGCLRSVGTRPRRGLFSITVLLGVLAAVGLTGALPVLERTFVTISSPVQLLMSVTVPFFGVLLASDLVRSRDAGRQASASLLLAAPVLAVGFAVFGAAVTAAVVATTASQAPGGRWQHALAAGLGAVIVQVVAQCTGTGWGLLMPHRPVVACLATVVVPLGLWALLGLAEAVRPAQAWLTPFGSVDHLLAGEMTPRRWAQELVVVGLWVVGLNGAGLSRLRRRRTRGESAEG